MAPEGAARLRDRTGHSNRIDATCMKVPRTFGTGSRRMYSAGTKDRLSGVPHGVQQRSGSPSRTRPKEDTAGAAGRRGPSPADAAPAQGRPGLFPGKGNCPGARSLSEELFPSGRRDVLSRGEEPDRRHGGAARARRSGRAHCVIQTRI